MLDATTISNTIDTVNRAAAALGVSPYGDDGLTFTRREFNAETKGVHIFWSLENLRDRCAVVVDHSETFTHSAILTFDISPFKGTRYYCYGCFKPLSVSTSMSEHDIALMMQTDNPVAVFASVNADIARFFANNHINAKNVNGCHYSRYDNETTVYMDNATVIIKYTPEFEGLRHFYRFDLRGYLRRQVVKTNEGISKCEEKAAKYQELADAQTAQAAKLRKLLANLSK